MQLLLFIIFVIAVAGGSSARSHEQEAIGFSIVTNVGAGNQVHVTGNHPDLGAWSPENSLKLRWTTGNVWTGQVAIQKGTALEYKFITRSFASNEYFNGANAEWEAGSNRTFTIPPADAAPYSGKTIYYYSGWTSVSILVVSPVLQGFAMERIGPGRSEGESLWRATGLPEEGEWVEFIPNGYFNGQQFWDNPPSAIETNQNYLTQLDAFILQDGQIYNYWPAADVDEPRAEAVRWIDSTVAGITGRYINITLPRGYNQHPWKRYPVVYFQDGQNITNGANVFGNGSWDADLIARREVAAGRTREAILVGIYNIPDRRRWEYNPPGDTYPGEPPGRADLYLRFLLDNVRPTLDFNYRTLTGPRHTFVAGSSMGGIFSLYAALETNVFGGALAMSPAVTRAPNYRDGLPGKLKRALRIYIDTGTNEGQVGTLPGGYYWDDPWAAYDHLQAAGYVANREIIMRAGNNHAHNEAAWRARLPDAMRFLLNARDEPNRIAIAEWPAEMRWSDDRNAIEFTSQQFARYTLQVAGENMAWTNGVSITETRPWSRQRMPVTDTAPAAFFGVGAIPED